ncbi:MAG: TM0996/MTH895 family glutaredoxin-like protein [Tissierellales bacterium]|nr:TM0996/MTH895 family glutaredoxin-like protein [Tissierellales bacterium]
MEIKILGSGCKKCNELENNVKNAVAELGLDAKITKVTDFKEIAKYGVMTTPALVVDEKVVSKGKVLKKNEVEELLAK